MKVELTPPEAAGFSPARLARIRPAMQAYCDARGFAGISTMIARRGAVVHHEQVGYSDHERALPLPADAIYRMYSMTKPIVCMALMTLFEEGKFQLNDPLAKFLPGFAKVRVLTRAADGNTSEAELSRPITLHDLFTHTAGFSYDFLIDSPVSAMYRTARIGADVSRTLESMVAELTRLPLAYQPGTRFHYSVAIDVLGHLIEVISGMPLQDFLSARIFVPLDMMDTGFSVHASKVGRVAKMYGNPDIVAHSLLEAVGAWKPTEHTLRDVSTTYPSDSASFARGGHGLFSTSWDYMRFAQMQLNRGVLDGVRILAAKTVDFMYMNHLPAALLPYELGGIYSYGRGFGLGSAVVMDPAASGIPSSVGEHNWGGAAKTNYWVDPVEQVVGVFMTQYMFAFDHPDTDFHVLANQALV